MSYQIYYLFIVLYFILFIYLCRYLFLLLIRTDAESEYNSCNPPFSGCREAWGKDTEDQRGHKEAGLKELGEKE